MNNFCEILESRSLLSSISQLGDANGDNRIDTQDFTLLSVDFGSGKSRSDFNRDGRVNAIDFGILATNFGREIMPLTNNTANGTDTDLGISGSWSLGHVPTATELAIINGSSFSGSPFTNAAWTPGGIQIDDEGSGWDYDLHTARVNGDVSQVGGSTGSVSVGSINGSLDHEMPATVAIQKSGDHVVNVGNASSADVLTVGNAESGAVIEFGNSQGTVATLPEVTSGVTIKASSGASVDLQGQTLSATTILQGPGTIANYTLPSGNSYATQQSGTKAVGSTVSGTFDTSFGFAPTQILTAGEYSIDNIDGVNLVISGGSYSFTVSQELVDNSVDLSDLHLHYEDGSTNIGIGGFTIGDVVEQPFPFLANGFDSHGLTRPLTLPLTS